MKDKTPKEVIEETKDYVEKSDLSQRLKSAYENFIKIEDEKYRDSEWAKMYLSDTAMQRIVESIKKLTQEEFTEQCAHSPLLVEITHTISTFMCLGVSLGFCAKDGEKDG